MKKLIFGLIIVLIFIQIVISINLGVNLSKLNYMYEDIDVLEDKIAIYYLNNGSIPISDEVQFEHSINPNDNEVFYKIDITKLDNIYLNYGGGNDAENDFYIINEQSHTIYYYAGVKYKGEIYFTKDANYELVEEK